MGARIEMENPARAVYLDANATTPLLDDVINAMFPWFSTRNGNASSGHVRGREARAAIKIARGQVAALIGARPEEIIFTSGGTEADNLAIFGTVVNRGDHVVTSSIEHHAVLHAMARLESRLGCKVTYLRPSESGVVAPEDVLRAVRPKTRLISIMMANNETGVVHQVAAIGRIARERGVLFHTDAVQAAGKIPVNVRHINCDLLSLSAHKIHGPQGMGALFVRNELQVEPMLVGGAHEAGFRAGTENVAGIAGFGKAAELAAIGFKDGSIKRVGKLRDALERSLLREAVEAGINGDGADRVPNTTNLWFEGGEGGKLLSQLDRMGLAVSGGSACNAESCEPSHVLLGMGLSLARASSSIRFSLSKLTAAEDVDFAIWQVSEALDTLRTKSRVLSRRRSAPVFQNV
jgi:cysteine desulfurase